MSHRFVIMLTDGVRSAAYGKIDVFQNVLLLHRLSIEMSSEICRGRNVAAHAFAYKMWTGYRTRVLLRYHVVTRVYEGRALLLYGDVYRALRVMMYSTRRKVCITPVAHIRFGIFGIIFVFVSFCFVVFFPSFFIRNKTTCDLRNENPTKRVLSTVYYV